MSALPIHDLVLLVHLGPICLFRGVWARFFPPEPGPPSVRASRPAPAAPDPSKAPPPPAKAPPPPARALGWEWCRRRGQKPNGAAGSCVRVIASLRTK